MKLIIINKLIYYFCMLFNVVIPSDENDMSKYWTENTLYDCSLIYKKNKKENDSNKRNNIKNKKKSKYKKK